MGTNLMNSWWMRLLPLLFGRRHIAWAFSRPVHRNICWDCISGNRFIHSAAWNFAHRGILYRLSTMFARSLWTLFFFPFLRLLSFHAVFFFLRMCVYCSKLQYHDGGIAGFHVAYPFHVLTCSSSDFERWLRTYAAPSLSTLGGK